MKKITITLLCFFLSASLTHARFFSIGPRVGASIVRTEVNSEKDNTALTSLQLECYRGYHVGVFTRLDLLSLYVQPEVLLTHSDAKFNKNNKVLQLSFVQLSIPVMVGCSFFRVIRAQIGPVFSLLLSSKEGEKDVKEHYNNTIIGWQGGLGFDVWKMAIDLKYEGNLHRFENKIPSISTNHGCALWVLSVGVNIL